MNKTEQTEQKTEHRRGRRQQNLVGQKYGHLTIIEMIPGHDGIPASVKCQCDCGNTITAITNNVKRGNTRSCGCMPHARKTKYVRGDEATVVRTEKKGKRDPKPKNLDGRRFGRLTVLKFAGYDKTDHAVYECQCDCGKTKTVRGNSLFSGDTTSCGCQRRIASQRKARHGDSREDSPYAPIYNTWLIMRERCHNPNSDNYKDYGGRGIKVCDEWNRYESFKEWSLDHGWKPGLSIDRIDVNGDYTPENCRWTDRKTQANNTRKAIRLNWDGVNISAYDWAKMMGLPFEHCRNLLALGGEPHLIRDYLTEEVNAGNIADPSIQSDKGYTEEVCDFSIGRKFGFLTVVSEQIREKGKESYVECQCVCGKTKKIQTNNLRSGRTQSCGCMKSRVTIEKSKVRLKNKIVVDFFRLYFLWRKKKDTSPCELCKEWQTWVGFRSWAAGKNFTVDCFMLRPNENKPYSPNNCILFPSGDLKRFIKNGICSEEVSLCRELL